MYQNSIIAGLVLVIIGMAGTWYIKKQKRKKALQALKKEFGETYSSLIDNINSTDDTFACAKMLLEKIVETDEAYTLQRKHCESLENKITKGNTHQHHEIIHISHQMRTSLSGILGFVDFLQTSKLTEEQKEFVSIIAASSHELLKLVNNIIDIAPQEEKIQTGVLEKKQPKQQPHKTPSVLVVDDNPINKRLLAKVFEDEALEVTYASDGKEAVSLRKENHFDIIFMDVQMPVMNGIEASKAIRTYEQEHNISPVCIVALTANTEKQDRDSYLDAGMNDYMAKPIMIEDVKNKIAQL